MNYTHLAYEKRKPSFTGKARLLLVSLLLIFFAVLVTTPVGAATKTWNTSTGGLWTTAGNWSPSGAPSANDDVVINTAQSASITAMPTISLNSLNVSATCRIEGASSGNTLTITGTFTVASACTLSLGNTNTRVVFTLASGASGSINGTGVLNFDAGSTARNFTISGDFTIDAGALLTDLNGGTGSDFILSAGGTLHIGNTLGITTSGATGAIQLTGTRTYTAGAKYEYNGTAAQVTGNGLTQNTAGAVTINNSAGVSLSAATTISGLLNMQSGTLNMANLALTVGSLTGSGNLTHSSGTAGARTLTVGSDNTSPAAYSGVISTGISSSVILTKNGTGTLTLSGNNSYTGATNITAGTLKIGATGTSPNSPLGTSGGATLITAGACLDLNGYTLAIAEPLTIRGTGISSGGALTNSSASSATYSGLITLGAAASIITNSGDIAISNSGTISGATFGLTIGGSGNGSTTSIIGTTSGTVTKIGTGTWTLSGNSTYTGLTTISTGTLKLGAAGSGANTPLGTNAAGTLVSSGGTLDLKGFTLSAAEAITINGTGSSGAGSITNSSATNVTYSGLITLGSASTITTNNGTISFSNTNTISGATFGLTLDGTQSNSSSISSIIGTTSGTVTKNGIGSWTLVGASTYTGLTSINAGILRIGGSGSGSNSPLGTTAAGTVVAGGASLDLNGYTLVTAEALTINGTGAGDIGAVTNSKPTGVTYSGLLTLGSSSLIDINNGAISFSNTGTITGAGFNLTLDGTNTSATSSIASIIGTTSGNVHKAGDCYWTLSGANTFTGGVTIDAGILNINHSNALGNAAGTFTINGGVIDNSTGADLSTVNYPLVINGNFTYLGTSSKVLDLGTGATVVNSDVTVNISAGTLRMKGAISGAAYNFVKGADGSLVFGSSTVSFKSLTIDQGLLTSTSGTMNIGGDFTNNGTFGDNGGVVNFNGTVLQTISGGNVPTFNVLKVNNASGVILSSQTITTGTLTIGDVTANSLFSDGGNQVSSTGTLNLTSGTFKLGASTATDFPAFSTVTISTGTTVEYAAEATQTVKGMTYSNLTISGAGNNAKNADGNITVNKTLSLLSSNASSTEGCLNMVSAWNSYPASRDESSYTLYMGATATTVGGGDVTGIIRRNTISANTSYTFGSQFTSISLTSGTMPSSISVIVKIGNAAPGKTNAVSRHYEILPPGSSGCFVTANFHYLDAELNGNTESKLTTWDYDIGGGSGTPDEHGRASFDFVNNYIGLSNIPVSYFIQSWRTLFNLGDHQNGYKTWTGTYSTDWNNSANWFPYGVPGSLTFVIIPDSTTTNYDPHLPSGTTTINTLTLEEGASMIMGSNTLVINNSLSGGWEDQNLTGNDPGTSTVLFSRPGASLSGYPRFYNIQIADTASLTLETGTYMRVDHNFTKSGSGAGLWYADIFDGTVEYTGGNQTVLTSNGTPSYHNLILSGSGTKTLPTSTLTIDEHFTMSGSVTVSPTNAILVDDDIEIGSGTTFNAGSLSHTFGKYFINDGTFNAGTSTITLNGLVPQSIIGTSPTTFYNLSLNNIYGTQLEQEVTINNTLTLTSGRIDLLSNNLLFGTGATAVSGSFDASTMIVADGGGEVRKNATSASQASFLFPIGDGPLSRAECEYSPIELSFSSGTFAGYVGVKVNNTKHPNNADLNNYLHRYWSINTSGVSSPVYAVTANYLTTDIAGGEDTITSALFTGALPWVKYSAANTSSNTLTASGLTETGTDFSGINENNPTVSISGGGITSCSGSTVNLTTIVRSETNVSYLWSTASTSSSISVSPTSTTSYTVTVTDENGITATANTTITVNAVPTTSNAGTSHSACLSGTTLAANTPSNGTGTWSISSGPSNNLSQISNVNSPIASFTPDGGYGAYTLVWTISNAPCTASSSNVTITVYDGPWIGSVSTDWTNAANWCGGVPNSSTDVNIANGATYYPVITSSQQVHSIVIGSAASLTINGGTLSAGNITNSGTITIGSSGVLDMGTNQLSGSGSLAVNGTIHTSNSAGFSGTSATTIANGFGTVTLNAASTIDYASSGAQTITAENYGNLSNSGGGNRTLASSGTIGVAGSFTPGAGTYTITGSTVSFNGTSAQSIPALPAESKYNNLIISNAAGVSMAADLNLVNALYLNSGTFTTTGHVFTLLSTASNTARIATITGGSIAGDVTMQRYISAGPTGWATMGMPVSNATLAQWNDDIATSGYVGSTYGPGIFNSVYLYDESILGLALADSAYIPATNITNTVDPKKGYFVYVDVSAPSISAKTIDVTGAPLTGTQDLNVTFTSSGDASEDGWNLVSNPYCSPINWSGGTWTKTHIDDAVYVYDSNTEQYVGSVDGVNYNGGNTKIGSSQAFFIHANAASPSLIINEDAKADTAKCYFKTSNVSDGILRINLNGLNGTYSDETVFRVKPGASNNFDASYDAYKLYSIGYGLPNISTKLNGVEYAVNAVDELTNNFDLPIRVNINTAGDYTIRFNGLSNFSQVNCFRFEDTHTQTVLDLTLDSVYTFSSGIDTASASPRFVIHFGVEAIATIAASATTVSIPGNSTVNFANASLLGNSCIWDFGDGSLVDSTATPSHTYTSAGQYLVSLTAYNAAGCNETATTLIVVDDVTNINTMGENEGVSIVNDAQGIFLKYNLKNNTLVKTRIYNALGEEVYNQSGRLENKGTSQVKAPNLISGIYFIEVQFDTQKVVKKMVF